ncbi:MAG: CoA transferase [Alphaproteobacteria bacterium]
MFMSSSTLPLARFRVLDLARVRSGPTAVKFFADWGADIIKIEAPPADTLSDGYTGDRSSSDFLNLHRNKRAICINLKEPDGKELFYKLVKDADVVIENYRPDVKFRLGIDYETLKKINPRIIMGSISGFGQDGPYAARPGVDQIAQGMGGFMSVTGLPGQGPVRAGTAISDLTAGMNCAMAVLIALLDREVTGEGQWVRTSLLESQIALMDFQCARWLIDNEVPPQAGNNHPKSTPTGVFPTSDGHVNIAAGSDHMWQRMCTELGANDMAANSDNDTGAGRLARRDKLNEEISSYTCKRTSADLVKAMNEAGVPCGPIYTVDQTFADPQVQHLGIARTVKQPGRGDIKVVGMPFTMSRSASEMRSGTPEQGEHTDDVLKDIGYDQAAIDDLRARGVV